MLLSMTGFGRHTLELPTKRLTIEVKSINSKQLDLNTRIPGGYRELELPMRSIISHALERGKVDLVINVEKLFTETSTKINIEALKSYKSQIDDMNQALSLPAPPDWQSLLLHLPDSMITESDHTVSEEEKEIVLKALGSAVEGVIAHRRAEGEKLEDFFSKRINRISSLLKDIEPFEAERVGKIRAKIEDGLKKITLAEYDKGRLEQEMIFYIEKLDVSEEKQRLAQHLNYFMETMNASTPGQGKKLGFISQEMGREINTLGSKSNHAEMQKIVVMMKDELEQIKEQVLNVM